MRNYNLKQKCEKLLALKETPLKFWAAIYVDLIIQLCEDYLRMREALEYYADKENYGTDDTSRTTGNQVYDIICFDFERGETTDYAGKRAREALSDRGKEQKYETI